MLCDLFYLNTIHVSTCVSNTKMNKFLCELQQKRSVIIFISGKPIIETSCFTFSLLRSELYACWKYSHNHNFFGSLFEMKLSILWSHPTSHWQLVGSYSSSQHKSDGVCPQQQPTLSNWGHFLIALNLNIRNPNLILACQQNAAVTTRSNFKTQSV